MRVLNFPLSKQKRFEELLKPLLPLLYKRAYHLTQSSHDAEELIQELLLKLYVKEQLWKNVGNIKSWTMKALYNLFVDEWRKAKRSAEVLVFDESEPLGPEDAEIETLSQPETHLDRLQTNRDLTIALSKLSHEHRALVVFYDIEGLTLEEIQAQIDVPIGTLKSRLHRARANLRSHVKKMEPFR